MQRSEYQKQWRRERPERVNGYNRTYWSKPENQAKYLLRNSKQNAAPRNLEHSITIDDIIVPEFCPVFSVPMVPFTDYGPSIDRIDSTKGYISGNIQVLSKKANMMKSNATQAELKRFAEWVLA